MPLPARTSPLVRNPRARFPLDTIEHGNEILTLLASLRFATLTQIQRVIFGHARANDRQARHVTTRATRRLFDSGFVRRTVVLAPSAATGTLSRQIVHVLSAQGARAIGVDPRWVRRRAPKPRQVLVHDYWLVELAVVVMEGCPESLSVVTWWDDRVLAGRKRLGQLSMRNVPDAYLLIENLSTGKRFPCLIELDLGSASVEATTRGRRDFAGKIEGYLGYLDGGFRREFAIDAPPVVLIVADSEERLGSLKTTSRRLGAAGRYWFSTLHRLGAAGMGGSARQTPSAARHGPFWAPNWQAAHEDGWRSLATRCGG